MCGSTLPQQHITCALIMNVVLYRNIRLKVIVNNSIFLVEVSKQAQRNISVYPNSQRFVNFVSYSH